jgi:hypothetical protein
MPDIDLVLQQFTLKQGIESKQCEDKKEYKASCLGLPF